MVEVMGPTQPSYQWPTCHRTYFVSPLVGFQGSNKWRTRKDSILLFLHDAVLIVYQEDDKGKATTK